MTILGIETSCDETSVAIIQSESKTKKINLISNIVASSLSLHSKTGGIIPDIAAREQVKYIIPVLESALKVASEKMVNARPAKPGRSGGKWKMENPDIDAIAVTVGPGLIGSLLVGVETAKTLSYLWKKPIIPVNHLIGHIYANFVNEERITNNESPITFPSIALIVSGGHTDLVLIRNHGSIKWLGGTRDDAAGEAFDKIGRLLNLPYPGGPSIEKAALKGNPKKFIFPKPLIGSDDLDFSFSGLKAAVFREVNSLKKPAHRSLGEGGLDRQTISDISFAVQEAIIDVLVNKTLKAADKYKVKSILLGGGVAANQKLRDELILNTKHLMPYTEIFVPQKFLCTDNAAMIASAAFYNYKELPWQKLTANPELYFY